MYVLARSAQLTQTRFLEITTFVQSDPCKSPLSIDHRHKLNALRPDFEGLYGICEGRLGSCTGAATARAILARLEVQIASATFEAANRRADLMARIAPISGGKLLSS
jgi:hypothetical protein